MRVLVTRPEPDGARTAARLVEAGHDPVLMPLFGTRMTASPRDLPPAAWIGGLIATSARALALFEAGDFLDKSLFDVPLHAVGPATAGAAQRVGFRKVNEAAGTASDLARTLVAHLAGPKRRAGLDGAEDGAPEFIYLAGVPRTPVIEQALEQAGVAFSVVECYEMIEISYSTDILISEILSPSPAAVLLYSANAARRLAALDQGEGLGKRLDSARFLCLSEAIAAELPGAWRARAVPARHPDEDSLLASLAALG